MLIFSQHHWKKFPDFFKKSGRKKIRWIFFHLGKTFFSEKKSSKFFSVEQFFRRTFFRLNIFFIWKFFHRTFFRSIFFHLDFFSVEIFFNSENVFKLNFISFFFSEKCQIFLTMFLLYFPLPPATRLTSTRHWCDDIVLVTKIDPNEKSAVSREPSRVEQTYGYFGMYNSLALHIGEHHPPDIASSLKVRDVFVSISEFRWSYEASCINSL